MKVDNFFAELKRRNVYRAAVVYDRAIDRGSEAVVELQRGVGLDVERRSGGEIQLTDALGKLIDEGQAFHGLRFDGRRFDCGDKLGFLEATVALGLQHPELGPGLRKILSAYL